MKPSPKETFETYSNVSAADIDAIRSVPEQVETALRAAMAEGESLEVGMTIDENSLHHIMAVLSELYSNPRMAILREYSTNAYDSHVEAGNPVPIQVTTPTTLAPMLKIQDFGVGLNAEDIVFTYSKYGLSTKTETNALTGVLGLGCKSAFTYTNQFTVIGIKDGIKTVCTVKRDEEGIGRITILDQIETLESDGVTIEIPVKHGDNFLQEVKELFQYWPKGSVLVNDEEPERHEGLKITDTMMLVKSERHYDHSLQRYVSAYSNTIVMGNVPYPVDPLQFDFNLAESYSVIVRVPNGSVHFTPSREALQYTTRTKKMLEIVREEFRASIVKAVNDEIAQAADGPAALRVALRWREVLPKVFGKQSFTWRGIEIPAEIKVDKAYAGERFTVSNGKQERDYYGKPHHVGHHSRHQTIELVTVPEAIWVYNFRRTFTPVVKKKLWRYCDENSITYPQNFIMCADKPSSPWIEPDKVILWDPIELIKLPRISRATGRNMTGRTPGSYDMFLNVDGDTAWDHDTPADEIDTEDLTIFYSTGDCHMIDVQGARMGKILDDFAIVQLTANRVAKFCRRFPGAKSYTKAMAEYAKEWLGTLSETDMRLLSMFTKGMITSRPAELDHVPQLISDPALREAKRLRNIDPQYRNYLCKLYGVFVDVEVGIPEYKNPLARYPLYKTSYYDDDIRRYRRHNRIYLNAAYEMLFASQEGAH